MGWPEIIERLHIEGKLTAARVDKAKTKGLISVAEAKKIKDKKKSLATESSEG